MFGYIRRNLFAVCMFALVAGVVLYVFFQIAAIGFHKGVVLSTVSVFTEEGANFDILYPGTQFNYKQEKVTDSNLIEKLNDGLQRQADWTYVTYNTGGKLVSGYVPAKIYFHGREKPGTPQISL